MALRPPDPRLADDVVSLRPLASGDVSAVEAALDDPEIRRWFDNSGVSARDVVDRAASRWEQSEAAEFCEAICGLANSVGGFVILGAVRDKKTGEWSLPGVVFPGEPTTWLDDVAESLRPRPRIDVGTVWNLDDDRVAVVVRVEPVAVPPCMTAGGQIFERTSGKTVRVTEPLVLARLMERGDAARAAAESGARLGVGFVSEGALRDQRGVIVRLGLRTTGYEPDIASRLFRESTAEKVEKIVCDNLKQDRYTRNQSAATQVQQERLTASTVPGAFVTDPAGGDRVWKVVGVWRGAVGIRCEGNDPEIGIELLFEDIVVPAWRAAASIVPVLTAAEAFERRTYASRSLVAAHAVVEVPRCVSLERQL